MAVRFFNLYRILLCLCFAIISVHAQKQQVVNIYNWTQAITPEVIQLFEKETGIKVNYDVYDSAEIMEAKLLAGHSGYDVVFVTTWPYLARQIESGVYLPLDKKRLSNFSKLDAKLLKKMTSADPGNVHAVPYLWGTTGFAFNKEKVLKLFPEAPIDSYAMLFDVNVLKKIAPCGVFLLDSPTDVFPAVLAYLGLNPNSSKREDLEKASALLMTIRSYIKKFQAASSPHDLLSGEACVAQGWSGELIQARNRGKELVPEMKIEYIIPKEGAAIWIDSVAIPKDAVHVQEAHIFINFIMRPDIMAKITNALETANAIPESLSQIRDNIKNDDKIYLSKHALESVYVDEVQTPTFERQRLREWTRVKVGR